MTYDTCTTCEGLTMGEGVPVGLRCDCGRHFHIGAQLIAGDRIECPTCGTAVHPVEITDKETGHG